MPPVHTLTHTHVFLCTRLLLLADIRHTIVIQKKKANLPMPVAALEWRQPIAPVFPQQPW